MDPEIHKKYIGVDNQLILTNLAKLSKGKKDIIVRIPIVPGFNDTTRDVKAAAQHVASLGIRELHLLPYHYFGRGKYRLLGRRYPFNGRKEPDRQKIEEVKEIVTSEDLKVVVGG